MSELAGKVAIVSGGSAGTGRAGALALAAEGAAVVVADIDVAQGEQVLRESRRRAAKPSSFART